MWGLTPGLCGLCGASAIPSSCRLRIFRYFWQKGLENSCLGFNVQPLKFNQTNFLLTESPRSPFSPLGPGYPGGPKQNQSSYLKC